MNSMIPGHILIPEEAEINRLLYSASLKHFDDLDLFQWIALMIWQTLANREIRQEEMWGHGILKLDGGLPVWIIR